jgi:hypothetical protein
LAWRREDEIRAPHDLVDTLRRVVNDNRELVGVDAIGATEHEVADLPDQILLDATLDLVEEGDRTRFGAQSDGASLSFGRDPGTTGSRVDRALGALSADPGDVFSAASAAKSQTQAGDVPQRIRVTRAPRALIEDGTVPFEPESI